MEPVDLCVGPPRRWSEELGGIKWLPRLVDKTRAARAGTLGGYLYGQSPIDRDLLHSLGIGHRSFTKIVANSATDDDVFRELFLRSPEGVERARAWSATLLGTHRGLLFIIDVDDGYLPQWYWKALRAPTNLASNAFTAIVKFLRPSHALETKP